ncbi:MAG: CDGSH iron-sulfur domain-containing protein [Arenicellales bacterium]
MSIEIEPKLNGPYLVRNLKSLKNSKGADISSEKDVVFLCRCAKSNNKPYCDGSHKSIEFSSAVDKPKTGKWNDYAGEKITIFDNRRLCAHAGHCTERLASVWRMGETPWIDPDGADLEDIKAVIEKCPSGALRYSIDGRHSDEGELVDEVYIFKNGPYHITGAFTLNDSSRSTDGISDKCALCRCGASKNKPFCDGSHWDAKFTDEDN